MEGKLMLDFLGKLILTSAVVIAMILVNPILYTGAGAIGGFMVGWAFNDTYAAVSSHLGWPFPAWQSGAFMAFIGSYLKAAPSTKVD
jgi:hypothetical protein